MKPERHERTASASTDQADLDPDPQGQASFGVMSRSVEFPPLSQRYASADMISFRKAHRGPENGNSLLPPRYGHSAASLDTPPESPGAGQHGRRGNGSFCGQNPVRMGVRSVQRKLIDQETGKLELEMQLLAVRHQLSSTQSILSDTRRRLEKEQAARTQQHKDYSQRVHGLEEEMRLSKKNYEQELNRLMMRLNESMQQSERDKATLEDLQQQVRQLESTNSKLTAMLSGRGDKKGTPPRLGAIASDNKNCSLH